MDARAQKVVNTILQNPVDIHDLGNREGPRRGLDPEGKLGQYSIEGAMKELHKYDPPHPAQYPTMKLMQYAEKKYSAKKYTSPWLLCAPKLRGEMDSTDTWGAVVKQLETEKTSHALRVCPQLVDGTWGKVQKFKGKRYYPGELNPEHIAAMRTSGLADILGPQVYQQVEWVDESKDGDQLEEEGHNLDVSEGGPCIVPNSEWLTPEMAEADVHGLFTGIDRAYTVSTTTLAPAERQRRFNEYWENRVAATDRMNQTINELQEAIEDAWRQEKKEKKMQEEEKAKAWMEKQLAKEKEKDVAKQAKAEGRARRFTNDESLKPFENTSMSTFQVSQRKNLDNTMASYKVLKKLTNGAYGLLWQCLNMRTLAREVVKIKDTTNLEIRGKHGVTLATVWDPKGNRFVAYNVSITFFGDGTREIHPIEDQGMSFRIAEDGTKRIIKENFTTVGQFERKIQKKVQAVEDRFERKEQKKRNEQMAREEKKEEREMERAMGGEKDFGSSVDPPSPTGNLRRDRQSFDSMPFVLLELRNNHDEYFLLVFIAVASFVLAFIGLRMGPHFQKIACTLQRLLGEEDESGKGNGQGPLMHA